MEMFDMQVPEIKGTRLFKDHKKIYLIAFCDNCSTVEIFEQTKEIENTKKPQIPCESCKTSLMDIVGWEKDNDNVQ